VESNDVVSGTEPVDIELDSKTETVDEIAANVEQADNEGSEESEEADKMQVDEVPVTEDESTEIAVNQNIEEAENEEKAEKEESVKEGAAEKQTVEVKLDAAVESKERDKLISALEGDWTDDDELPATVDTKPKEVAKKLATVPQSKEITSTSDKALPKRSTRSSAAKDKFIEEVLVETCTKKITTPTTGEDCLAKDENAVEQKLDSLMGDWTEEENNSQTSATDISTSINESKDEVAVEAAKEPTEEEEADITEPEPVVKPAATEEKSLKKVPKKSVKNGNDEKPPSTTVDEKIKAAAEDEDDTKEPSTTKTNEISTLMDDWDDDDL
jgi:hypothetical protein